MNLQQAIRLIERTAAEQPNIGTIVRNDVFRLNASPVVKYGAFAWLQNEHTEGEQDGFITFSFTFFYVDRLTENKANEVEVQSTGIETLWNIIRKLEDYGLYADLLTFRTFNERFSDECAGVFCNVSLQAAKDTLCATAFDILANVGDYNLDFNKDFNCWEWQREDRTIYII